MAGYNKILVCADGSKGAEEAVRRAAELSLKFGSSLTMMFVWEPPNTAGRGPPAHEIPQYELDKLDGARKIVKDAGIKNDLVLVIGHPAKSIVDESKKGYDLLVLGSRGLGGVEGFLLGSVTSRVAHHAKIPLLIVPG